VFHQDHFAWPLTRLRRTAGAQLAIDQTDAFPEPINAGLVTLAGDSPIQLVGMMTSVGEGVLVDASVEATAQAQCSRCLTSFELPLAASIQELFVYPERRPLEDSDSDEDINLIEGDQLRLDDLVRDAIVLEMPLIPLCRPDCAGLCPICGVNLNDHPDHQHSDTVDARWLGLAQWGKLS
jgi:uncharacterized protein